MRNLAKIQMSPKRFRPPPGALHQISLPIWKHANSGFRDRHFLPLVTIFWQFSMHTGLEPNFMFLKKCICLNIFSLDFKNRAFQQRHHHLEPTHSGPEWNQSWPKILITIRRLIWSGLIVYWGFVDPLNWMEVFSNSYDVIKILFPDWSINKFIVMHRKAHKIIVI